MVQIRYICPSLEAVILIFLVITIVLFVIFMVFFNLGIFSSLTVALIFGYIFFIFMYPFNYLRFQESIIIIVIYLVIIIAVPLYILAYTLIISCIRRSPNPLCNNCVDYYHIGTDKHTFLYLDCHPELRTE